MSEQENVQAGEEPVDDEGMEELSDENLEDVAGGWSGDPGS